jgi:4-amino-4-deoxy-L-arabinose transferase-like glycosyltransferase
MSAVVHDAMRHRQTTTRRIPPILWLAALLLIVRMTVLLLGTEALYYPEEGYRGTIAYELVTGLKFPFLDYRADDYQAGSLIVGVLAAPLFGLFGSHLILLKCVALAFALATLCILYGFAARFFGRSMAILTGLLWIFPPPALTRFTLTTMGSHTESLLFTCLALYWLYELLYSDTPTTYSAWWLGITCGLGFWFASTMGLTILFVVCMLALMKPRVYINRAGLAGLCGGLLGLLPWLYSNIQYDFAGLRILRQGIDPLYPAYQHITPFLLGAALKSAKLLGGSIPHGLFFADWGLLSGNIIAYLYYVTTIVMISLALMITRRTSAATRAYPLILYIACFVLAYTCSAFVITHQPGEWVGMYRYLVPLYPVGLLLIAWAVRATITQGGRLRALGTVVIILLLASGVVSQYQLITRPLSVTRGWQYPGHAYDEMALELMLPDDTSAADHIAAAQRFTRLQQYWILRNYEFQPIETLRDMTDAHTTIEQSIHLYRHLLYCAAATAVVDGLPEQPQTWTLLAAVVPTEQRADFYRHLGRAHGAWIIPDMHAEDITHRAQMIMHIPRDWQPAFAHGCYWSIGYTLAAVPDQAMARGWLETVPLLWQDAVYAGYGAGVVGLFHTQRTQQQFAAVIAQLPVATLRWVYRGLGQGIFEQYGESDAFGQFLITRVDRAYQQDVRDGYAHARTSLVRIINWEP